MTLARVLPLLLVPIVLASGCATVLTPTVPSAKPDVGEHVGGVRFDADEVTFREPALPVSSGNIWKREVAAFTADTLNDLVDADGQAPVARTVVTFEMHAPGMVQIGSAKEMTVRVVSTLPDGRIVRSEPQSAYLDSNVEFVVSQCLVFGGPILDIAAFVLGLYLFTQPAIFTGQLLPVYCGCIIGLALVGLSLNLAQVGLQYLWALLEERRWSDLYVDALRAHADDVRAVMRAPAPVPVPTVTPPSSPTPPVPSSTPSATPPALAPVPAPPDPLDDPLDAPPAGRAAPDGAPDAASAPDAAKGGPSSTALPARDHVAVRY